jgi:UDP-2,3-diacylglucosamine pyrophosphatase LpxH
MHTPEHHRTVWLSDLHLGSRDCRVGLLLDFLCHLRCDTLYLVGDIIDLQSLRRSFYWPSTHMQVFQRILRMAQLGTRVIYIPGNHDDDLRALAGKRFGGVEIAHRVIHTTASGQRLLVLHGDEFDSALQSGVLAGLIGRCGYRLLLALNRLNHAINELLGQPYWSLAHTVKMRVGKAVRYVMRFQDACLTAAREAQVDGVVCGHIHKADIALRDGLLYCNDGDWVESCTALVEDDQGVLSLRRQGHATALEKRALAWPLRDAA